MVQPISARGSKTARLHMRAKECCSKRGTQSNASEPESCMSRRFEALLALGMGDGGKTLTSW